MDFNVTVRYDYISGKFNFKVSGLKVKVTVAIFRKKNKTKKKNVVIALTPAFINGF